MNLGPDTYGTGVSGHETPRGPGDAPTRSNKGSSSSGPDPRTNGDSYLPLSLE